MAVTLQSRHNVYVSFRHFGDPATPGGLAWTDRLVAHLLIALRERAGRLVDVRLDRQKALSVPARELIEQRILQSAFFVAVLSPEYLGEERTQWEMETALSPNSRVRASLIVEALPIGTEEGATRLEGIPTLKFWDADEAGEPVALTDINRIPFSGRISQLADVIIGALASVEQVTREEAPEPDAPEVEDEDEPIADEVRPAHPNARGVPVAPPLQPAQPVAAAVEAPSPPSAAMAEPPMADIALAARKEEQEAPALPEPEPVDEWEEPAFFTDFFAEVAAEYSRQPATAEPAPAPAVTNLPVAPRSKVPLPAPAQPAPTPEQPVNARKRSQRPRRSSSEAPGAPRMRWVSLGIAIGFAAGIAAAAAWIHQQDLIVAAGDLLDALTSFVTSMFGGGSA